MSKPITRDIIVQINELEAQLNAFHGYRNLWAELIANHRECGLPKEKLEEAQYERLVVAMSNAYSIAQLLGLKWTACETTERTT